jgi:alpha-tubulin suppressor-like RCC1 family protein
MPVNICFSVILLRNGRAYSCGKNTHGQLGVGDTVQSCSLKQLQVPVKLMCVAPGYSTHCVAVGTDGSLWGWGCNTAGQLGIGITSQALAPTQIPEMYGFISVAAGVNFSLALHQSGEVWCYGSNIYGQLGLGDFNARHLPTQNESLKNIIMLSAGCAHSLALDANGELFSCGQSTKGKLGFEDFEDRYYPQKVPFDDSVIIQHIAAGQEHNVCIDSEGRVWGFGSNCTGQLSNANSLFLMTPTLLEGLPPCVFAWCGSQFSIVKSCSGSILVFGDNSQGQLSLSSTHSKITPTENPLLFGLDIIANGECIFCVDSCGQIFSCGYNSYGQLGTGDTLNRSELSPIEDFSSDINPVKSARIFL